MQAGVRLANHVWASVFAAVVEVGLREPSPTDPLARAESIDEWGAEEVRAAMTLTRTAADSLIDFAQAVVVHLPDLHTAMSEGRLDRSRAWLLWTMTQLMSPAHARAVCARLLPLCDQLTTGQLAARIRRTAIALGPGLAATPPRRSPRTPPGRRVHEQ